jgi:HSP20 family protein
VSDFEKEMSMAKQDFWLPLPMQQLSQEVDRLFDELIHRPWGSRPPTEIAWNPQLDLYETPDAFVVEVDLPGVKEQEVTVEIEAGDLVLRGTRSFEQVKTEGSFYFRERRSGRFTRRLHLPASVDREQIRADFRNGVLQITLPKIQRERTREP